jgi:hypothetical protein
MLDKFVTLHPCIPSHSELGFETRVRHAVHPRQGAPITDCHDRVFYREEHHVTLVGDLVGFHALGEGSRCHEILHHAIVLEVVPDRVGVVRTSLLKELLEVIYGWPCLTLAAASGSCDVHHTGDVRLLVVATITNDHGCGLLKTLLAPLPTALGTLPGILDGDVG